MEIGHIVPFTIMVSTKLNTQGLLDISVCLIRHFDFFNLSSVKKSVDYDSGISEKSYWAPWEIYRYFDQNGLKNSDIQLKNWLKVQYTAIFLPF